MFKGRDNKLFLYAATNIVKGEKLCHSWAKNLLYSPTSERQKMLKHIFIQCQCVRCMDSSELGTDLRCIYLHISYSVLKFNYLAELTVRDARELCCLRNHLTTVGNGVVGNVILNIQDILWKLFF